MAVATRALTEGLIGEVSYTPERYGAAGDGTTDDTTSLSNFFAAATGRLAFLSAKTYRTTARIDRAFTNCAFIGVPGATIIRGNFGFCMLRLLDCENVLFQDITFENTWSGTGAGVEDLGFGLVWSQRNSLTNVAFNRCRFTVAPNTNAIKLNASTNADGLTHAKYYRGISITDCHFEDVGRMAVELLNQLNDADRYVDVNISGNTFKDLGMAAGATYGMAVSFSGVGRNLRVNDNQIDNPLYIGIEFAGPNTSEANGNWFRNCTRDTALLATSSNYGNDAYSMTFANNKTDGHQSGAEVSFSDLLDSSVYGNKMDLGGYVDLSNSSRNRWSDNKFKCRGLYGLLARAASGETTTENDFDTTEFDCSSADPGAFTSVLRFEGSGTTRNRVRNGQLTRPGAGSRVSQFDGASENWLERTDWDTSKWSGATLVITMSDATMSLTSEQGQFESIEFRGTLTASRTIFTDNGPDRKFFVHNNTTGGFDIDFRPASGSVGITVPAGTSAVISTRRASSDAILIGRFA